MRFMLDTNTCIELIRKRDERVLRRSGFQGCANACHDWNDACALCLYLCLLDPPTQWSRLGGEHDDQFGMRTKVSQ